MKKEMKHVNFRIEMEVIDFLEARGKREERNVSQMVRLILKKWIREKEEENNEHIRENMNTTE